MKAEIISQKQARNTKTQIRSCLGMRFSRFELCQACAYGFLHVPPKGVMNG